MERKSGSAPQLGTLIAAIKERFRHGLPPLARSGPSSAQIASKQTWLPMLLSDPRRLRDAHLKPNVRVSVPNTFYEVSISIPKG